MRYVEPTPDEAEAMRAGHEHLTWQVDYLGMVAKVGIPIMFIFNVAAWSEAPSYEWTCVSILFLFVVALPGLNPWHPAFKRQRDAERAHSARMEAARDDRDA